MRLQPLSTAAMAATQRTRQQASLQQSWLQATQTRSSTGAVRSTALLQRSGGRLQMCEEWVDAQSSS